MNSASKGRKAAGCLAMDGRCFDVENGCLKIEKIYFDI